MEEWTWEPSQPETSEDWSDLLSKVQVTDVAISGLSHVLVLDVHGAVLSGAEGLLADVAPERPVLVTDHVVARKLWEKRLDQAGSGSANGR